MNLSQGPGYSPTLYSCVDRCFCKKETLVLITALRHQQLHPDPSTRVCPQASHSFLGRGATAAWRSKPKSTFQAYLLWNTSLSSPAQPLKPHVPKVNVEVSFWIATCPTTCVSRIFLGYKCCKGPTRTVYPSSQLHLRKGHLSLGIYVQTLQQLRLEFTSVMYNP